VSDLLCQSNRKALYGSALCVAVLHGVILFGWSRVVLEESAFGVGHQGVSSLELVALPAAEPTEVPIKEEVVPPPPPIARSEFKKKREDKQREVKPTQQPTVKNLSQTSALTTQATGPQGLKERLRSSTGSGATSAEPDYLRNPPPSYPRESRRLREQGVVLLTVSISRDGEVKGLSLKHGSGFSRLDESALVAVKSWRFKPALLAGIAIDSEVEVPIRFALK
jgi:periplasmic protein TonB